MAPFADTGVAGATFTRSRRRGGSDHTSFNEAGLPGIGVSQDPIEYQTYTWHTNLDTYERVIESDAQSVRDGHRIGRVSPRDARREASSVHEDRDAAASWSERNAVGTSGQVPVSEPHQGTVPQQGTCPHLLRLPPVFSRTLIKAELPAMLRLAGPVILAELGWMSMGIVDTIMVGRLGPEAIAASGISNSLQIAFAIFGMGLLLGLDTLISQAFGARRIDECNRWFWHGTALAAYIAPVLIVLSLVLLSFVPSLGFHPRVEPLVEDYYAILLWSGVPLLFYAVFRRYLQAIHAVTPVMIALVTANVVNAVGNWALIYGHAGLPALGLAGSAAATLLARVYLAGLLLAAVFWYDAKRESGLLHSSRAIERARLTRW